MAKRLTGAALSVATALTGCLSGVGVASVGGSTDDSARLMPLSAMDPVDGTVRFFGTLDVTREPSDGSQAFDARFGRFDAPVPASVVRTANLSATIPGALVQISAGGGGRAMTRFPIRLHIVKALFFTGSTMRRSQCRNPPNIDLVRLSR